MVRSFWSLMFALGLLIVPLQVRAKNRIESFLKHQDFTVPVSHARMGEAGSLPIVVDGKAYGVLEAPCHRMFLNIHNRPPAIFFDSGGRKIYFMRGLSKNRVAIFSEEGRRELATLAPRGDHYAIMQGGRIKGVIRQDVNYEVYDNEGNRLAELQFSAIQEGGYQWKVKQENYAAIDTVSFSVPAVSIVFLGYYIEWNEQFPDPKKCLSRESTRKQRSKRDFGLFEIFIYSPMAVAVGLLFVPGLYMAYKRRLDEDRRNIRELKRFD